MKFVLRLPTAKGTHPKRHESESESGMDPGVHIERNLQLGVLMHAPTNTHSKRTIIAIHRMIYRNAKVRACPCWF
jgi:hypothetical protein